MPRHSCAKTQQNFIRIFLSAGHFRSGHFQNFPHRDDFSYNKLDLKSDRRGGKGAKNHPSHIQSTIFQAFPYIFRRPFCGVRNNNLQNAGQGRRPPNLLEPHAWAIFSGPYIDPADEGLRLWAPIGGGEVAGSLRFSSFRRRREIGKFGKFSRAERDDSCARFACTIFRK